MTHANLFENKPEFIYVRKKLRSNPTMAEKVLWKELKGKQLEYKFRRQFNIDNFIVDFCCYKLRLVIELDGPVHEDQKGYDKYRENILRKNKFYILRFKNDEVLFDRERVIERIKRYCLELENKKV